MHHFTEANTVLCSFNTIQPSSSSIHYKPAGNCKLEMLDLSEQITSACSTETKITAIEVQWFHFKEKYHKRYYSHFYSRSGNE